MEADCGSKKDRCLSKEEFDSQLLGAMPALRACAWKLERDRDRAEDLVQQVLVKAIAARGSFDGENMKAWLRTIATNSFINSRRQEKLHTGFEARMSHSACGVWRSSQPMAPDAAWSGRDVERALDSLQPEYRDIVVKVGLEGLRYKEAAAEIGCPIGTVMSRLHRARAAFARAM